ncbi:carboxypeptidase regulatory-like domain-containing protein [Hydrogenophaga sp.]|uniref:carboxypeptidase regulatory-like domain-containing protein n=1 Tax=Hydrogenophaga sp. TaxID=1904254 RepID=UPI002FC7E4CF
MKTSSLFTRSGIATALVALSTTAALAAGPSTLSTPKGDVRYLSGGIGETSQMAMQQARSDYSLSLNFARADGAFITGVDLEILDARGKTVLSREDQDPMVLVDLPAGRYTVVGTFEGETRRHAVDVPRTGHRHVVLNW